MYGSLLKSITKNKEYRYNDIVSAYDTRYSDSVKKFLPKALPDGPESPRLFSTDRVGGVAYNSFNASPVLPAYLTILGYTDFISFIERYYNWLFTSSPENDKGFGSGYYTDTDDIYKLIDIDRVSFVDADSDGEDDDGDAVTSQAIANTVDFPAGLTIYGRWTAVTLNTGKAICYVAPASGAHPGLNSQAS